jgi:hypothetical protein
MSRSPAQTTQRTGQVNYTICRNVVKLALVLCRGKVGEYLQTRSSVLISHKSFAHGFTRAGV